MVNSDTRQREVEEKEQNRDVKRKRIPQKLGGQMFHQKVLLWLFELHQEKEILPPHPPKKKEPNNEHIWSLKRLCPVGNSLDANWSYPQRNRHECVHPAIWYIVLGEFLTLATPESNETHYYPMNEQELMRGHHEV